jgi:hypothetical protein
VGVGATGVSLGRGVGEIRAVGVAAGVDVTYTTVTGNLVAWAGVGSLVGVCEAARTAVLVGETVGAMKVAGGVGPPDGGGSARHPRPPAIRASPAATTSEATTRPSIILRP